MSPKEKAMDIFNKMCNSVDELIPSDVIECALIAVNEILNNDGFTEFDEYLTEYWEEVKKEIEKL